MDSSPSRCPQRRAPSGPSAPHLQAGLCARTDVNGAMLDVYNGPAARASLPTPLARTRPLQVPSRTSRNSRSLREANDVLPASSMKPVPAVLLLAAVLLTTHIPLSACRPRDLGVLDGRGYKKQLDEVLLRAGDSAVSYLLGEKLLQYLQQRKPSAHRSASISAPAAGLGHGLGLGLGLGLGQGQEQGQGLGQGLGLGWSAEGPERGLWREDEGGSPEELVGFSKRSEEPPISIDLTFHLLRNMIEMARIENQREQAELNRKYLDEVGK
ncbi:hypothetical protein SRHO_G00071940 [Serrasalmus rhombeus]